MVANALRYKVTVMFLLPISFVMRCTILEDKTGNPGVNGKNTLDVLYTLLLFWYLHFMLS